MREVLHDDVRMPVAIAAVLRSKFYYANVDESGNRTKYEMARCKFTTNLDFRYIVGCMERRRISNTYNAPRYKVHEASVSPLLQFICENDLRTVGWHRFTGFVRDTERNETWANFEMDVNWKSCLLAQDLQQTPPPPLESWSFDLEVYSSVSNRMPVASNPSDKIIQISLVSDTREYLLHIGVELELPNKQCIWFATETEMIIGFVELCRKLAPDFLLGYNILGFDIKYLIERAQLLHCFKSVQKWGLHKTARGESQTIKWSSSAYKCIELTFVPLEGIVLVDMLFIIRRDYKFANYRLDTVVKELLDPQAGKDEVTPLEIFRSWESQDVARLAKVGAYCLHDSRLVLDLYTKLLMLTTLSEMASICFVNIFDLYTRGQQLKVFAQIYKHCCGSIVIDKDSVDRPGGYAGAHVVDPKPGIYTFAVSMDFQSLYPSIIQGYNICPSTCVADHVPNNISDDKCHVLEWEDHVGCTHDPKIARRAELTLCKTLTMEEKRERKELVKYKPKHILCAPRRFRFVRDLEGVIPVIIRKLLVARKAVKTQMKQCVTNSFEYNVLNARQTALKLSANSMYGFFGTSTGYLPFIPAAMAITYLGRISVLKAVRLITQVYGGELIYGDTDSVYASFPSISGVKPLWDWAIYVADMVSREFPNDVNIQFEEVVYVKLLMTSKKRYVYQGCDRDGNLAPTLGKKGVLLVRRDSCLFKKTVYSAIIERIFADGSCADCVIELINHLVKFVTRHVPISDIITTKQIGDANNEEESGTTENGKMRVGDYIVPRLPDDPIKRERALRKKGCTNERDFIAASLPAQIQLAYRMRQRGALVENGSRIEYVVTDAMPWGSALGAKFEDVVYFINNSWWLNIDTFYYLNSFKTPIDQIFWIVFKQDLIMTRLFDVFVAHAKVMHSIRALCSAIIVRDQE